MQTVGIIFLICGGLFFIAAALLYIIYRALEYSKTATDKVSALLICEKHKKNVPVYSIRRPDGPIREVMQVKNYRKGRYEYCVNGKRYKISYAEYLQSKPMPKTVSVIFIKHFPRPAYVSTDANKYDVYSIVAAVVAVMLLLGSLSVLCPINL